MIVWQGWGISIPFALVLGLGLIQSFTRAVFRDAAYYQQHGWPKLLGFLIAAGLIWGLATFLSARAGHRVVDKATGRELILKSRHSLYCIDIKYWPFILAGLGVISLLAV